MTNDSVSCDRCESRTDPSCEELLKSIEKRRIRRERQQLNIGWYFWLLTKYPGIVIFLSFFMLVIVNCINWRLASPFNFSEPAKGFEVRGTELSTKLIAWKKLVDKTSYCSPRTLSAYPCRPKNKENSSNKLNKISEKETKDQNKSERNGQKNHSKRSFDNFTSDVMMRSSDDVTRSKWNFTSDYFCGNPQPSFGKWIFEPYSSSNTLWTLNSMKSMCRTQNQLLSHATYRKICNRSNQDNCCPTISLVNFVTYLSNRSTCEELIEDDLNHIQDLLAFCAPWYCSGQLHAECWESCQDIPSICTYRNTFHTLFHYLIESRSVCDVTNSSVISNSTINYQLKHTMVFVPVYPDKAFLPVYLDNFDSASLSDKVTSITGIDFRIEGHVFSRQIIDELIFPIIAGILVLVIITFYTGSIFVTLICAVGTGGAMTVAYFIYTVFLKLRFFPFLNITACLVMLGLTSDNVILYYNIWLTSSTDDEQTLLYPGAVPIRLKRQPPHHRLGVVAKVTWRHASKSLGVTGVTTGVAFFANVTSQVTAVKCFGIFTGLAVLCNLLFSLTLLPAAVIFQHKHFPFSYLPSSNSKAFNIIKKLRSKWDGVYSVFFNHLQLLMIVRFRWLGIFICSCITGVGFYALLASPGVRFPSAGNALQYFGNSHPFENFRQTSAEYFQFINDSSNTQVLKIRVVFGVRAIDGGDYRDPDDIGELHLSNHINITARTSQRWLMKFCKTIRKSPFVSKEPSSFNGYLSNCLLQDFVAWTSRKCTPLDTKCCGIKEFPMPPHQFNECVKEAVRQVDSLSLMPTSGPRFSYKGNIRALVFEFPSTIPLSASYEDKKYFYDVMNSMMEKELKTAPQGLQGGWFVSDLEIYSLQGGLLKGTVKSLLLSLAIALVIVLMSTFNLVVSLMACVTIGCIIVVVSGFMCLIGWELNVLESITVSIAVGLSVDFTSHYAVAYLLAPHKHDRQRRVEHASTRLGPAITLAAFTTFVAGMGLVPSSILAYQRFGVFLIAVMVTSWVFSTYFFLGLLSVRGPEGERCSMNTWTCCCCCCCHDDQMLSGHGKRTDEHTTTILTETSSMRAAYMSGGTLFLQQSQPQASSISHHIEVVERSTVI